MIRGVQALIVGAGSGGLAAALALQRAAMRYDCVALAG